MLFKSLSKISNEDFFKLHGSTHATANYAMLEMIIVSSLDGSKEKHIVYETTLKNKAGLEWAVKTDELARKLGYTPVVVYPLVFRSKLYKRAFACATEYGRLPAPEDIQSITVAALVGCLAIAQEI